MNRVLESNFEEIKLGSNFIWSWGVGLLSGGRSDCGWLAFPLVWSPASSVFCPVGETMKNGEDRKDLVQRKRKLSGKIKSKCKKKVGEMQQNKKHAVALDKPSYVDFALIWFSATQNGSFCDEPKTGNP